MRIQFNKLGRKESTITDYKLNNDFKMPKTCEIKSRPVEKNLGTKICPHCGSEFYCDWKIQHLYQNRMGMSSRCNNCYMKANCDEVNRIINTENERVKSYKYEEEEFKNLSKCLICGGELLPNAYIGSFTADSVIVKENEKEAEQLVEQFAMNCDVTINKFVHIEEVENIAKMPLKLMEYIKHLIELEMGIYSLKKRLKDIYVQCAVNKRNMTYGRFAFEYEKKMKVEDAELQYQECVEKLLEYKAGKIGCILPQKPTPPVLGIPNMFNKKKVLAENEVLQARYQEELNIYEKRVQYYEERKEIKIRDAEREIENAKRVLENAKVELEKSSESKDTFVITVSATQDIIAKEKEEAEELLKKMYECRNGLYGYNIIFGKYRNVVALSTFYEYLVAGRCTGLQGADGAYNMYESETRADMIIGQLSQVIEQLEEIKETQYMIYSELQTVNNSLNHLNKTMDAALSSIQKMEKDIEHISANTDVIAHNTALTAYYSKLNAELTNSLGFMMAM